MSKIFTFNKIPTTHYFKMLSMLDKRDAILVSAAHANHFIKSLCIYFCVFIVLYLKTTSFNSLKIMKKSPTTEFNDECECCNVDNEHKIWKKKKK